MVFTLFMLFTVLQSCCAQFTVQPESVIQAEGLEAVFECLCQGATAYSWAINGSFLSIFPTGVNTDSPSIDSPTAKLIIPATPQYNNTVVQCRAVVEVGGAPMYELSKNTTLRVQGPLHSVIDFHFLLEQSSPTTITISWDPPFSLNLTTAEPNIQYCVNMFKVTGGGDNHLQSVCDITDTYYTFTASDPDQLFNFTVTPRSNVEGSLNGTTSEPVQGYLIQEPTRISSNTIYLDIVSGSDSVDCDVMFPSEVLGQSPGNIPTSYQIKLTGLDTSGIQDNCSATPTRNTDMTVLVANCIRNISKHRLFNVTVITMNSVGETESDPVPLSTHDVQSVKTSMVLEHQLDITCSYLSGSTDFGCFVIVWSESEIIYRVASRNNLESNTTVSLPCDHSHEDAMAVVFDLQLKDNMRLPEVRPAVTQPVTNETTNNTGSSYLLPPSPSPSMFYSNVTSSHEEEICMSCSFSAPELTGCVGVIHSAQLDNLTLTVLTVERSGGRNCTNMPVGNYFVAIFGMSPRGLDESPVNQSMIEIISKDTSESPSVSESPSNAISTSIGGTVSSVTTGIVVVIIIVIVTILHRRNRRKHIIPISQNDRLMKNHYSDKPSGAQGGPPPPPSVLTTTSRGYEDVEANYSVEVERTLDSQNTIPSSTSDREYENVKPTLEAKTASFGAPPPYEVATTYSDKQVHYAHVNIKSDSDQPSMDHTAVQYASIDKQKLVPASSSEELSKENPAPLPLPPPPPTPETVLSELHPIAIKWKELGEALGVPEHILNSFSMEGSDLVRLHELVQFYFSIKQFPHSWNVIARALGEIGEIEAADRIVRTKMLELSLPTTPQAYAPPLPPKGIEQEKRTEQHQHNARPCEHEAIPVEELDEYKSDSNFYQFSSLKNSDEKGDSNRKTMV